MRSIKSSYEKIASQKSNLGTYICLAQAVKGRNFSRKSLVKAFKEIMPKDDYVKEEISVLIDNLETLTNHAVEGEKRAK